MARTNIAVTPITTLGVRIHTGFDAAGDVANGNEFDNDGATFLLVRNSSAVTAYTLSFSTQATVDGQAVPSKSVNLVATGQYWFGPFKRELYNQANGRVPIDVNNAAVFIQAIRIPPAG